MATRSPHSPSDSSTSSTALVHSAGMPSGQGDGTGSSIASGRTRARKRSRAARNEAQSQPGRGSFVAAHHDPAAGIVRYLVTRYSSIPSGPPEWPKPEWPTPPNGAATQETLARLTPTIPAWMAPPTRIACPQPGPG